MYEEINIFKEFIFSLFLSITEMCSVSNARSISKNMRNVVLLIDASEEMSLGTYKKSI